MFAIISSILNTVKLSILLILFSPITYAETFSIEEIQINLKGDVYYLDASLSLPISNTALSAIKNGVPLFIALEVTIKQENDWWLDTTLASIKQVYKIEFFELAKIYQLTNLNTQEQHNYLFLGEALLSIGSVKSLPLIDKILLKETENYYAEVDIDLLISKLPIPLIPAALLDRQWEHKSSTYQAFLD